MDTDFSHARALPSRSAAIGHHQHKRRGFNLIEAAIVLGVVGVVVGGIWAAASAVSMNFKVSETLKIVVRAVPAISALLKDTPISSYVDGQNLTHAMLSAGAIPAKSPFGGNIGVAFEADWGQADFVIVFQSLNKATCIPLAAHLSGNSLATTNLRRLLIYTSGTTSAIQFWSTATPPQIPITFSEASAACENNNGNIGLQYRFR